MLRKHNPQFNNKELKRGCQVPQIKLVSDLNSAALRSHQDKELGLWYCLRSLNYTGSGVLSLDRAIQQLQEVFHYPRATLFKYLRLGEGTLWERHINFYPSGDVRRTTIKIKALKTLIEYFGINRFSARCFTEVKISEFQSTKQRRAQLYATIHCPIGERSNPISRETITELTGLHKVQQRRYEKATRVKRTPNYAMQKDVSGIYTPVKVLVNSKNKQHYINKRLPNIYHSRSKRGAHGMLRKVKVSIRHNGSLIGDEATPFLSCYFSSIKRMLQALKAKSREVLEPSYRILPNKNRYKRGRLEWVGVN